jgi:hypothetical protein
MEEDIMMILQTKKISRFVKPLWGFVLLLFFLMFNLSCKNDTSSNQIAILSANYYTSYTYGGQIPAIPYVSTSGVIFSSPMVTLNYFKVGDSLYNEENLIRYGNGSVSFANFGHEVNAKLDPLTIEISTSLGILRGTLSLPETLVSFEANVDTLTFGQDVEFFWNGSNASFYWVSFLYLYRDSLNQIRQAYYDTLTTQKSVRYDGSLFYYDGTIELSDITPVNGPFPIPGTVGNISGDGSGYLYYYNRSKDIQKIVIVGRGLHPSKFEAAQKSMKKENFDLTEKIATLLGYKKIQK